MGRRRLRFGSFSLALLGALTACSNDAAPVPVASVAVTPPSASVQPGVTVQLGATAKDANGNPLNGKEFTWTSDSAPVATVDPSGLVTGAGPGLATITATSEGQSGSAAITVTKPVCSTAGGQAVTLAVGAYVSQMPVTSAGCLLFPGNASAIDSAQYLLVPQIATDSEGATTSFDLFGDTLHPALVASRAVAAGQPGPGWGERFHDFLRQQERSRFAALAPLAVSAGPAPAVQAAPPVVGSTRTFKVCSNVDSCLPLQTVTATAKTVTGHLALYVDNAAPSGGLTQGDLDSLGSLFDARLYAIDTTAFGRESDIDGNGVVAVLMTGVVNKLVNAQQCQSGFIAGFFFGADIDPVVASQFNHGEVFYSIVADPTGSLSCAHSASQLRRLVPVTFIHEFQHMISYNQHVLVAHGDPQVTWLDEGMSHFAEELGGRSFLPSDQTSFSNFVINDLFNAYSYLDSTGSHFLAFSAGIGTIAERGAAWLFVRYLADQFAADTSFTSVAAFTRSLEQSGLHGGPAIATATGTPFATVLGRWVLATYVSDLPGFTPPAELQYRSWSFRTTFASLHLQRPSTFPKVFPLTPALSAGDAVSQSGLLLAGSGVYTVASQPPSGPGFALLYAALGGTDLPAALTPRLNVIRIR